MPEQQTSVSVKDQKVIEIVANGDLYLDLDAGTCRLLVSSAILSLSSIVFDKMLNSRFREGQAGCSKREVSLPDDDAQAMTTLCRIFHHRTEAVSMTIDTQSSKNIALLSDKYGCMNSIRPWLFMWLNEDCDERDDVESLYNKLQIAYLVDLPAKFNEISWYVLLQDWRTSPTGHLTWDTT